MITRDIRLLTPPHNWPELPFFDPFRGGVSGGGGLVQILSNNEFFRKKFSPAARFTYFSLLPEFFSPAAGLKHFVVQSYIHVCVRA